MLGIKVKNKYAESVKRHLQKHELLDRRHRVFGRNSFIYFPMVRNPATSEKRYLAKKGTFTIGERFEEHTQHMNYRDALSEKLGRDYGKVTKSFEILGNIAIIDVEKKLSKKVAEVILETHKNVETILRKEGAVSGKYRMRGYGYVAGKRNFLARYKENGSAFVFDVRKTFFSPRLSFERRRISNLSKRRENVVVMFAGVGPFAIEIAKSNRVADVVAIELNRYAYNQMLENIKRNKVENVDAKFGDVKKFASRYRKFADRIIMPLPKDSSKFLYSAFEMAKKGCTVHYYTFAKKGKHANQIEILKSKAKQDRLRFKLLSTRVVRPYSHDTDEIVVDFRIS